MGIVGGIIGMIFLMAAAKEIIPLIARALDAVILMVVRAPFRWIAHRIRSRSQLTPYQRGRARATEGAFLAVSSISAATWFPVFLDGQSVFDLIAAFAHSPTDCPGVALFLVVAALGLIWFAIGMQQARGGDRDSMSALWSAGISGVCIAALWWHWYPSPEPATLLETAGLKTLYVAAAAAGLVRLWLTMPMPNPSLAAVNKVLRQRNAPMVGAQPRRRFFFR
jgi:hypothetical protein